jgi:hypothetical protein
MHDQSCEVRSQKDREQRPEKDQDSIKSVHFRLQNLACPGLRARVVAAWGQLPERSPGCWLRSGGKPAHRSQRRNVGNGFPQALPVFLFFSEVSGDPLPVAGAALPSCCMCWWAARFPWRSHKPRPWTAPPHQGTRRHWRGGDRPGYLSGPRRKEPRSAAERLLALETKFLLFWVGQERDSVLSR